MPQDHSVSKLERLTVDAQGHPLTVWSRRPPDPQGVVVLLHGRTWGARTAFDFEPRAGSRSLLKALAAAGYATYAVDLRGYGETARDRSGWLSPGRAAAAAAFTALASVSHEWIGTTPRRCDSILAAAAPMV